MSHLFSAHLESGIRR